MLKVLWVYDILFSGIQEPSRMGSLEALSLTESELVKRKNDG